MTEETTDKLLREFLLDRRQEEKKRFDEQLGLKKHVSESTNAVSMAFQSFSKQLTERFDRFETDQKAHLDRVEKKAETAHQLALGVASRVTKLEEGKYSAAAQKALRLTPAKNSIPPTTLPTWDLGEESPTGTHHIIPIDAFKQSKEEWSVFIKENLEVHDKVKDGETWRWLKENATKMVVAVLGTVIAAAIIANLIATAQKNAPATNAPSQQH
jgi:hypothetical protein